jgi:hypothetical protein
MTFREFVEKNFPGAFGPEDEVPAWIEKLWYKFQCTGVTIIQPPPGGFKSPQDPNFVKRPPGSLGDLRSAIWQEIGVLSIEGEDFRRWREAFSTMAGWRLQIEWLNLDATEIIISSWINEQFGGDLKTISDKIDDVMSDVVTNHYLRAETWQKPREIAKYVLYQTWLKMKRNP